jgi:hypothetical protein
MDRRALRILGPRLAPEVLFAALSAAAPTLSAIRADAKAAETDAMRVQRPRPRRPRRVL